MARNRVIYQSQALFIAPSSTGCQVSGAAASGPTFGPGSAADLLGGSGLNAVSRIIGFIEIAIGIEYVTSAIQAMLLSWKLI